MMRQTVGFKALILGFLFIVLLIPAQMILGLVRERQARQTQVTAEVSSKWGGRQSVIGPILVIPYQNRWTNSKGQACVSKEALYLLPQSLKISGDLAAQTRLRSIYKVSLYENHLVLEGDFSLKTLLESKIDYKNLLLKESLLVLSVSDLKGIQGPMKIRWQGQDLEAKTGMPVSDDFVSAVHANVPALQPNQSCRFSIEFQVRGSYGFFVAPVGEQTSMNLKSDWPHPSFDGAFLPASHTIGPAGFTADWNVSYLNRDLPQFWTSGRNEEMHTRLQASAFGLLLAQPVNHYSKTERSVKYAGLFFVLTFAVFFLNEILAGRLFHPIQYLMVGFALSLFYLLLLSLSEFISFDLSYGVAALMITLLLTIYTQGVFQNRALTRQVGLFFVGLYSFLYTLLQLEDHALLVGSLALFVALSWIMLASRKIDWYHSISKLARPAAGS